MSSKSTLFLTEDNEHFYEECNSPHYKQAPYNAENFEGYTLVLEMNKRNVKVVCNDDEDLILEIEPGSQLYKLLLKMRED